MRLTSGVAYALIGLGIANVIAAPIGCVVGSFIGGGLFYLYGLYLGALGGIGIEGADRQKTFVAAGVLALLLVLIEVLGFIGGLTAHHAIRG